MKTTMTLKIIGVIILAIVLIVGLSYIGWAIYSAVAPGLGFPKMTFGQFVWLKFLFGD